METLIATIKEFGPLLGYVSTGITLYILIKTQVLTKMNRYIAKESGKEESERIDAETDTRLTNLEEQFMEFIARDGEFKERMERHILSQNEVDKKLMANIIESTYYANRCKRELDSNELRRVTEVYALYSGDEIHGNSYISTIYNEMMGWDHVS